MDNKYWLTKLENEVLPVLKENLKPKKIILFGSRAVDSSAPASDIDLIIISDVFKEIPFLKRMSFVLKQIKFPKHLDILCYTPEEFEMIKNTSAIVQNALTHSQILF
jgi:predicted nucleotidyltransferase